MSQISNTGGVARKLVVGIEFSANTQQANRALDDLVQKADRVAQGMTKAQQATANVAAGRHPLHGALNNNSLGGGGTGPPGGTPAGPPPGGGMSDLEFFGRGAGMAAAAAAVANVAESLLKLGRSGPTARQQMEGSTLGWIPGFNAANRSINAGFDELAYGDTMDRTQARERNAPFRDARLSQMREHERRENELYDQLRGGRLDANLAAADAAGRGEGAMALFGAAAIAEPPAVRAAREQRERSVRGAAVGNQAQDRAIGDMQRARGIATESRDALRRSLGAANQAHDAAQKRDDLEQPFLEARSKLEEQIALTTTSLGRQEEAIAGFREKALTAAKADYQTARDRTNEMRKQVEILGDQEQTVRGAARQWGSLEPHEQDEVKLAFEMAKDRGYKNLPPEMKGVLHRNALTAEFAGQESERIGSADPGFQDLVKGLAKRTADDLAAARIELEGKIDFQVKFDEGNLKKALMNALKEINSEMNDLMVKSAELQKAEIRLNQLQNSGAEK